MVLNGRINRAIMLLDVLDALTSSRLNKGNSTGMQECFCHGVSAGSGKVLAGLGWPQEARCTAGLQRDTVKQSTASHLELCPCFHILGHREFMDSAVRWGDGEMPCKCYSACRRDTAREITTFTSTISLGGVSNCNQTINCYTRTL